MPQRTRARNGEPLRFLEQAIVAETDECIPWPFSTNKQGYGEVRVDGRTTRAHRVVLERTAGPAPVEGMYAAHAPLVCHNPSCIQWRHLRWATPSENCTDKTVDGTMYSPVGERCGGAKLTDAQVLAIRADSRTNRAIAADFGLAETTIGAIKRRVTWPHI